MSEQSPLDTAVVAREALNNTSPREGTINVHQLRANVITELTARGWGHAQEDTVSRVVVAATKLAEAAGIQVV